MIKQLFTTILYQPLYNLLIWLYNTIPLHDLGLAIIILTIFVKLILYPFFSQSIKSQRALMKLQPKIDELNKKYKGKKDIYAKELMILYRKEKVNPYSSCLPLLIQLPILIAVYQVFIHGLTNNNYNLLYPFIANPGKINTITLGILDLSQKSLILAVFAGLAQFWQSWLMTNKKSAPVSQNKMAGNINKQMTYLMPIFTVVIGSTFPSGLALYWFVMTILSALQQLIVIKKADNNNKELNNAN